MNASQKLRKNQYVLYKGKYRRLVKLEGPVKVLEGRKINADH